jgi:hypothetical protein
MTSRVRCRGVCPHAQIMDATSRRFAAGDSRLYTLFPVATGLRPVPVETPIPRKHYGNSRRPSHTNDFYCRASAAADANLIKSAFHRMEPTGVERHRRAARRVSKPARASESNALQNIRCKKSLKNVLAWQRGLIKETAIFAKRT